MSADTHDTPRPLGEISQEPNKLDQFLERHHKSLIALAAILVLAAAAYIIHREMKKGSEHEAGAALTQADDMAAYQKIIKDHPGTAAAGSADLLLADKQWADGQQDTAIETLKKFLAGSPDHAAASTARASLGSKLSSQGKNDEAVKVFEELASSGENGGFLAPYALLSLGDIARTAGDTAKAEEYYLRAQNEYASSTFANTAISRLALLKAKPPVEIDPPPAPAEPAPSEDPTNLIPAPSIPGLLPTPETPVEPAAPAPAPAETAPEPAPAPAESAPSTEPAPAEPSPAPKP